MLNFMKISDGFYGWCDPYDIFCLYNNGISHEVSNLIDAYKRCKEINNNGWPVEFQSKRVKPVFVEFVKNYSLTDVILNANKYEGSWYWKEINVSVDNISNVTTEHNDNLIYNYTNSRANYTVVCMIECSANWILRNNTQMTDPSESQANISEERCKYLCETSTNCSSFDWNPGESNKGCWLNLNKYNPSKAVNTNSPIFHHVINRDYKSIITCIHRSQLSFDNTNVNKLVRIIVPVILIFITLIIVVVIIISVMLYRREKYKTDDNAADFETYKSSESPRSSDHSDTKYGNSKNIKAGGSGYINVVIDEKDPNRYPGPMGDNYTDINFVKQ